MTARGIVVVAGLIGATAVTALAIGFATAPEQTAFSYLTAWTFVVSIVLGALVLLMIGHAMEVRWFTAYRRTTEAIVATLPVLALLFVPIALSVGYLYLWVDPPQGLAPEDATRLAHKAKYLNVGFWIARAAIYFTAWIAIATLLRRSRRPRAVAAVAFPIVALTLTFAAFDWVMSLTPLWYSTIFGLLYFSGGFVGAIAAIAAVTRRATPDQSGALGRVLFAFLVFWAYMEFAQGLVIWIANKPDEVPWYVQRGAGAWGDVFAALAIGHFVVPFFALLSRELKRRPRLLAIVGAWLVVMHYVDIYWLIMPVAHRALELHWLDAAAPAAIVSIAIATAALRVRPEVVA